MATVAQPLSDFHTRVLQLPEAYDLFLGGGRGGSKSHAMALLALRHAEQYGERARILYLRQSYKGIADFELITRQLFGQMYGTSARFNASEHVWRLPGGAYFELGQLETEKDYIKFQGRSFSLLMIDEAGQYPTPDMLDRLRSNLRATAGVPIRMVMAANPGDAGHHWLSSRYVFSDAPPWSQFMESKSKREWIYAPSTYLDNPYIDQEEYRAQLSSSCPSDPELLRAWLEGDWAVARGAFFASVISEERSAVDPQAFGPDALSKEWRVFLSHDYGASAPSVTYVVARSPGELGPDGRYYPAGSFVIVDELATNEPGSTTKGLGWTVPVLAEAVHDLAGRWSIPPNGVADDAIFGHHGHSAGSIAEEFRRERVYWQRAHKGTRVAGWQRMRKLLQDAGKPDVPGLYISRACKYFWETVPFLARDPKKADDVDTRGPDHGADAARYAVLETGPRASLHLVEWV